jgi:outer membrane scaffolding protein for murein synthesis (MipA/OmpV family)
MTRPPVACRPRWLGGAALLACQAAGPAWAQAPDAGAPGRGAIAGPVTERAPEPAAAPATEAVVEPPPEAGRRPRFGVAVGAVASIGPEFAGSSRIGFNLQPGLALRWGRVSLASRSAFAVRGEGGTAQGGLRVELLRSERWRSSLGLRWDSGRDEDSAVELEGLGDVRATLRARLSLGYRFDEGWRAGASFTNDILGRGGGWTGEFSLGRDTRLSDATGLGASLTLGLAGRRWQQAYYGVTPEQAARTGYAVYTPGTGLRELGLGLSARTELGSGWALFYGASVSRLVGPAAASPLVTERQGWGLSAGVVKRLGGR